jgi:hypothetical protein
MQDILPACKECLKLGEPVIMGTNKRRVAGESCRMPHAYAQHHARVAQ